MRNTPSARAVSRRSGKSLRPLHCRAGCFLRIPNCERPAAFFLCFFGMRRAVFYINFRKNTHMGRKSASTAALYAHQEKFCARRGTAPPAFFSWELGVWSVELDTAPTAAHTFAILCTARERPRLPLRREVDACIKDFSRQTEGEIHRVCAKTLYIDNGKSK